MLVFGYWMDQKQTPEVVKKLRVFNISNGGMFICQHLITGPGALHLCPAEGSGRRSKIPLQHFFQLFQPEGF